MAKRVVGLYVGTNSVDVVELGKTFRRPRLIEFARAEISPVKEAAAKKEETVRAIHKVFEKSDIKTKEVVTALPEDVVIIRYFQMGYLPKKEREQGVRFEARKYIPFKLEEVISDFQVVQLKGDAKQMGVVFAAAKKGSVNYHISLLQRVGLKATIIEPNPFSLMRIFHLAGEVKKGQTMAIVNIDIEGASISILKDNVLYLTRSVTLVSPPEEEATKTGFESLLSELHLSFDYYKRQYPKEPIGSLILCGEGNFEGWDELLIRELKMPARVGDLRKGIAGAEKVPDNISPKLAVAAGLALRGLVAPIVRINLGLRKKEVVAPPVVVPTKEAIRKIVFTEAPVVCLLLLVIYFGMFIRVVRFRNELKKVEATRPDIRLELAGKVTSPQELLEAKKRLDMRLSVFQTFIDERVYWTEKLSELARFLPEGTWLDSILLEEKEEIKERKIFRSLTLKGGAYSEDEVKEMELVDKLITNLRENEQFFMGFQELKVLSIQKGEREGFEVRNFELSCSGRR